MDYGIPPLAAAGLGVAGLLAAWQLWWCWTGRYRWRWARDFRERALVVNLGPFVVCVLLGTAAAGLIGEPVGKLVAVGLYAVGWLLLVPGFLLSLLTPSRWWLRWFRQDDVRWARRHPPAAPPGSGAIEVSDQPGFGTVIGGAVGGSAGAGSPEQREGRRGT